MWKCELVGDATEEQVEEAAAAWLTAARAMKGGEQLRGYVYHPVAVNDTGESDFVAVVIAPSFEEWGRFWDGYPDSPAAAAEEDAESTFVCPDSAVWSSTEVKAN